MPSRCLRARSAAGLAVLCLMASASYAQTEEEEPYHPAPPAEVAKKIDAAREAWRRGDKLGEQARSGLLDEHGNGEANLKLLNEQGKDYEAAEAAFREAITLDRKHPLALEEYGRYLLGRGRFGAAAALLERALMSPKAKDAFEAEERADLLRMLAGLMERGGQSERAVNLYRHALELNPRDARNNISLAVALCAQGEPDAAQPVLKAWLDGTAAGARVTPAQQSLGFYTLGYIQEQTGKPEDALTSYGQARQVAEKAGAADASGIAEQAKQAARRVRALLRELNPDLHKLAQARLEALVKEFKTKDKPLSERFDALAQDAEGKDVRALTEALAGLSHELHVQNKPLIAERLLALNAELSAAAEARQRFAKANWNCNEGVKRKGEALLERKAFDAAMQKYFEAKSPAEIEAAKLQTPVKQLEEAAKYFQDALQAWPKLPRAHVELGWCRMAMGEVEAACAHFDAAVLYDPLAPYALVRQAEVRFMLEDWEGAEESFARLTRADPEYGRAYLGLARVAAKIGTTYKTLDSALDALDRAERLGVIATQAGETRKMLNDLVARLDRGEKLVPLPSRKRSEAAAAPAAADPFKGVEQNVFGP
ncbi:MAG: tetratricopeptide repeat protein [Planctomycetes bacterium]|nr:tetratricopeptide repeat protein [Planctomycetota bacterium]